MSYIVLARKYRPQTFSEVYAQEHITQILQNAVTSKRIAHAYLFTGPRGVGKTSMARILAKSLNCETGPTATPCNVCTNCIEITTGISNDVIEIDGASNTGVDDIRELQRELIYAPSQSLYKIYIIDEVHMLSKNAFNALLKTLEEPPDNVIFIFATTEPFKVLPTIISRCQRFDFKRIPIESIVCRLRDLAEKENIQIDSESLYLIARKADGGLRDALSLMDQVLTYDQEDITIEKVRSIFGVLPNQVYLSIFSNINAHDSTAIIQDLHEYFEFGLDIQEFVNNLIEYSRLLLMSKLKIRNVDISAEEQVQLNELSMQFSLENITYIITLLIQLKVDIKNTVNPLLIVELALIKLTKLDELEDITQLINRISNSSIDITKQPEYVQPQLDLSVSDSARGKVSLENKIIDEIRQEKAAEPLTVESLQAKWNIISEKITKERKIVGIHFSQSKLINVKNDKIWILATSENAKASLSANCSIITNIISRIYCVQVKLDISYQQPEPQSENIVEASMQELKQTKPFLAELIELTDSKVLH